MICQNCETKNPQDAKYCKNCGKSLKNEEEKNEFNILLKDTKNILIGILKKPIDTIETFINSNNYQNGIIYLAFNIVTFSFIMIFLSNIFYDSYMLFGNFILSNIPYFKIFLLSIIFYLLSYLAFGGITYLVSKYIFKSEVDYKKIISWLGINSVLVSILYLIITICLFISIKLSCFVLLIGVILNNYNLIKSTGFATNVDDNKVGYLLVISTLLTLLLIGYILPILIF